jgi:hypothetical protein
MCESGFVSEIRFECIVDLIKAIKNKEDVAILLEKGLWIAGCGIKSLGKKPITTLSVVSEENAVETLESTVLDSSGSLSSFDWETILPILLKLIEWWLSR